MEKGKEEGVAIGIKQTNINMLKENVPIEQISQFTGLSVKAIELLKESLIS